MTYVIASVAHDDLLSIWAFSAERWNEDQADLYIDAITIRFAWLTRNIGLWQKRSELAYGLYSYPEKSHVIIFRKVESSLQIIRVLHVSMDLDRNVDR